MTDTLEDMVRKASLPAAVMAGSLAVGTATGYVMPEEVNQYVKVAVNLGPAFVSSYICGRLFGRYVIEDGDTTLVAYNPGEVLTGAVMGFVLSDSALQLGRRIGQLLYAYVRASG
jgi:hypothetical protein